MIGGRKKQYRNFRGLLIVALLIFLQIVIQSNLIRAQNKFDFGIFSSTLSGQMEIRIRPNYAQASAPCDNVTNPVFTIKWPVSSGITSLTSGISPIVPGLLPQGSTSIDNGYYYQVWAYVGGIPLTWTINQELVLQTFTFTGPPCPVFEIASDSYTEAINGMYYMEMYCGDYTGILYSASAQQPTPGTPGSISGTLIQQPGLTGQIYSISPVANASTYNWSVPGGWSITGGQGTNIITVTTGNVGQNGTITVTAGNNCGTSAASTLAVFIAGSLKTLNLHLFLEGLYNSATGLMNQTQGSSGSQFASGIADTVRIELHNATSPFAAAYVFGNTLLHTDGTISVNTVPGSITGLYYLVIKHRNSIETWSSAPVDFGITGPVTYDFTNSASKAYGNSLKLMGTKYAIWAGDVSQDGIVNAADMTIIFNAAKPPVLQGYYPQDINGDGIVDGSDMVMIDNNASPPSVHVYKP
jgi:hypothetical protein